MIYNFDEQIDRRGTDAEKIDGMRAVWGRSDLIPMWVADMDFATPSFVVDAIRRRCECPVLGYTAKPDSYYQAIIRWVKARYGMEVKQSQLHYVPGIVPGLGMALNAFTRPGDKVLIMPPVYHPFAWLVTRNRRELITCPLVLKDGHYRMDLELFRRLAKDIKVFILCNPHNPGGVVWTRKELEAIAAICAENNVLVFSDEIHADLTLPPYKHVPFALISEEAREHSVTFMAPSKAFNMPGLAASHVIIYNKELLNRFHTYVEAGELDMGHVFAFLAVEAAYSHGTEWLEQCIAYIQGNIDYVDECLKTHMPKIKAMRPMASYLIWLDCRELGLPQKELNAFFVEKAGLALNDGEMFGKEGSGFMRMNVGCPRAVVERAMKQLEAAYRGLPIA